MMRATYRRVAGWLKKTIFGRRSSTSKGVERVVYLSLLPLEERVVMTANLFLPQSINPLNGINQNNPTLQAFPTASDSILSPVALSTGSDSWHSNISILEQGAYNLSLQETGPLGADTFFLSESGSLQYTLTENGTYSTTGYGLPSVVLTQTGTLDWTYIVRDANGQIIVNESGSDHITTGSLGTAVVDPFFVEGFNWIALSAKSFPTINNHLKRSHKSSMAFPNRNSRWSRWLDKSRLLEHDNLCLPGFISRSRP